MLKYEQITGGNMNFCEFITKKETATFRDVIPLLQQIYVNVHNWNVDDNIVKVMSSKREYVINKVLIDNIDNNLIEGEVVYDYAYFDNDMPVIDKDTWEHVIELKHNRSYVNIKSLSNYLVKTIKDISLIPVEMLKLAGIDVVDKNNNASDISYEDIISDETIMKYKNMSLPQMKQQVAILSEDKKKSDAAIMAAAKISLLFVEEGLHKPATLAKFVSEYKKHLDKFPKLQDTVIKRIYKNLPEGYRISRDGGSTASVHADIRPIIRAAVFAGSMANDRNSMDIKSLGKSLSLEQYVVPENDILDLIIESVKKLDLDLDT